MTDFERGLRSRPVPMISLHITDMINPKFKITSMDEIKVLHIEDTSIFMTENQAEQLFAVLEKELFEETFKEIEDKYLTEKVKANRLEEELEQLKEKYEGVLING